MSVLYLANIRILRWLLQEKHIKYLNTARNPFISYFAYSYNSKDVPVMEDERIENRG
jgi:hypothetical protein